MNLDQFNTLLQDNIFYAILFDFIAKASIWTGSNTGEAPRAGKGVTGVLFTFFVQAVFFRFNFRDITGFIAESAGNTGRCICFQFKQGKPVKGA